MMEELNELKGIEYDAYFIHIGEGDQFTSGLVGVNPNSKIPAMYDKSTGARAFESGAILFYLAKKYDAFLPKDPVKRAECMSWVFFQVGSGPYYGGGGLSLAFKTSSRSSGCSLARALPAAPCTTECTLTHRHC